MTSSRWRIIVAGVLFLGFGISQGVSQRLISAATTFPDPIAFYAFDEANGSTTAADRIRGNSGEATLYGAPTYATGRVGNSLCLNGTSQYGTAAIVSGVTSEFTISSWVKLNDFSQWATIVKNWANSSTGTFHFGLDNNSRNWSNYIGIQPNSAVSIADPNVTTTAQWHHVVTTASQSQNQIRLYVNNVKVSESTFAGTIKSFGTLMSFGAKLDDNQTNVAAVNPGWLNGCLDEVAFWDIALSDTQVGEIYTSGQSGTSPIAPAQVTTPTIAPATTATTEAPAATTTVPTLSAPLSTALSTQLPTTQEEDMDKLPVSGTTDGFLFLAYVLLMSGATVVAGLRIQNLAQKR